MPTEVVIAPKNGVTVSFAGHDIFAGHIIAMTFDAIQVGSKAHDSLVSEMQRESFRTSLRHEAPAVVSMKNMAAKLYEKSKNLNQSFYQPYERKASLSLALKNLVYMKLDAWATRVENYVDSFSK